MVRRPALLLVHGPVLLVEHGGEDDAGVDLAAPEAADEARVADDLGPGGEEGLELGEVAVGGVEARAHRGLEAHDDPAHVLAGHELAAQQLDDPERGHEEHGGPGHDQAAVVEGRLQDAEIGSREPREGEVHLAPDTSPLLHREEAGAAHGGQGQGLEQRDEHRHRDRDPELEEELPDDALHEGHGQEDGHDGEGGGGGGEGDLARPHRGRRAPCPCLPRGAGRCSRAP